MNKKSKKSHASSRKNEVFGVILIGLGVILLLSILTYNQADNPHLNLENNSIKIKNILGLTGAIIAQPLINYTLGYPILFLPIVIIIIGFKIYIKRSLFKNLRLLLYLFFWAILLSVYLAIPEAFETYGKMREYFPSGLVGGKIATFMVVYLGKFGTILVLATFSLALVIANVQIRISDFFKYITSGISQFTTNLKKEIKNWKVQKQNKKKERARLKLEAKKAKSESEKKLEINTNDELIQPVKEESHPDIKRKIINNGSTEEKEIKSQISDILIKNDDNEVDDSEQSESSKEELGNQNDAESASQEPFDFEIEEEAQIEEVDYDQLVRESVAKYEFPPIDLLESKQIGATGVTRDELKANADLLESKLLDFGVKVKVVRVTAGPVITLYELRPSTGVKVRQVVSLADDLALAMEAKGMRMIAPIPGKAAIGIEIPNKNPQIVYIKPLICSEVYTQSDHILPIVLGKTINGDVYCADLTKMPHLLMAGATGSGKSVGINTLITSIFYSIDPGKVKFVMVDPKKIELSLYKDLRDHFLIWRTDLDEEVITKPSNAISMLNSMTLEMEKRYDMLAHLGVRNIEEFNERVRLGGPRVKEEKLQQIPYIILIIDELADMMMMAAKEVEIPIARLAQMARAIGIHLILATQRPSVDVITGIIKANFPARIAYMVTSRPDSKTILDMNGAEKLLGKGDMLYQPPGEPRPVRLQNPIISTEEVKRIVKHIKRQPKLPHYSLPQPKGSSKDEFDNGKNSGDLLYEKAKELVITSQQGSISYLQRRLKIGYSRAARLIDEMEEEGIVGPAEGGKPRHVYSLPEDL